MPASPKGTLETILVVDDNQTVRKLVVTILEGAGFRVISADSGPTAIILSAKTKGKIDLLLTDWDMPDMSGIALGQVLLASRPEMHVMQMSGGAHDSVMVLNYGWAFLQKPFVGPKLVKMITDVLHSPNRSQGTGESFDSRRDTSRNSAQPGHSDNHLPDSNEPEDSGEKLPTAISRNG